MDFATIRDERPGDGIARIAVDRDATRNAKMRAATSLEQLGHSNNQQAHGMLVDQAGLPESMRPDEEEQR